MRLAASPDIARAQRMQDVRALYLDILGREPDPGAINWVNSSMTLDQIRQGLADSPEGQERARKRSLMAVLAVAAAGAFLLLRRR